MQRGPVDCLIVSFVNPNFDGSILAELRKLADQGTIRVLDFLLVYRAEDGAPSILQIEDLPPEQAEALGFVDSPGGGLFNEQDGQLIVAGLAPGTAAGLLAVEHVWVVGLRDALRKVGADMAVAQRMPSTVVDEAYAGTDAEG